MNILPSIKQIIQGRKSISAFLIEYTPIWVSMRMEYPDASAGTYSRYVIESDDEFDVVLIIWGVGAYTGFHGHPSGGCWLSVFEGPPLIEELPRGISNKIMGGYRAGLTDQHAIRAIGSTASIHIYKHR